MIQLGLKLNYLIIPLAKPSKEHNVSKLSQVLAITALSVSPAFAIVAAPTGVPTLSTWGIVGLAAALGLALWIRSSKSRKK
jgi:hypothetical protein